MSRTNKLFAVLVIFVLIISIFLTGCGKEEPQQSEESGNPGALEQPMEKILRSSASDPPNIDPGVGSDYVSSIALCNLYDTLVFPEHDGSTSPHIATDWTSEDDGLTWIFNLQQGVKFHNGDELTAEDVVFSVERLKTMGEGYGYLFTDVIGTVEALDDYKVKFTLTKPFGPFLNTLVRVYIVNAAEVMAHKEDGPYGEMGDYGKSWLTMNDAGSGPYMVKEMKKQEHLLAVKFPDYWEGWDPDAPETIQVIGTTSAATVRTLMTNYQLEISDQWQTEEALKALGQIPGIEINSAFVGSILNIMLNTQKAPTDDIHFRKALSYIFDYQTVTDKLFPGCKQAFGPVPFNLPGHKDDIFQYTYNLEKAKEELAQSKYADKLDEYPIDITWIAEVPDEEKIALLLQANAAQIGIKVNVQKVPWLTFVDEVSTVENTPHASIVFVSPHYSEAGSILESRYHSKSTGTWEQAEWLQDAEIDAAISEAIATVDPAERYKKYEAIQEKLVELAPTIWVFDQAEKRAYQSAYVDWPGARLNAEGKPVSAVMGYNFYFHDYKVFPENMPK
ncbi:MAG: ABC transporter substrate-binding protein [Peptococcaceae bacterium]